MWATRHAGPGGASHLQFARWDDTSAWIGRIIGVLVVIRAGGGDVLPTVIPEYNQREQLRLPVAADLASFPNRGQRT